MSAPDVATPLREAVADTLLRAHRFVSMAGDDAARARGAALLRVSADAVARREATLAERAEQAREPRAAARVLARLAEIRALRGRVAAALAARVARAQRADGSWRAAGHETDPDPALPSFSAGDADPLHVTGVLAALLARSAAVGDEVLAGAARFLAGRFTPELVEGAPWEGVAAFAAPFSNVAHEEGDAILQWCGRELEKGFRSGRLAPLGAARVLVLADARALPGASLAPSEVIAGLVAAQAPDGGFGEGAASARVTEALDAVGALLHLAGVRGGVGVGAGALAGP